MARSKTLVGTLGLLGTLALVVSCGAVQNAANSASGGALGGSCPDVTKPESILAYDFVGNFKISADAGAKLKASTAAAVEVKGFADEINADLVAGCGGLAKDLGAQGDFKDGKAACDAALKAMADVKAKFGANAKISLVMKPPQCRADMNVMADCAGKCDVKASGGKAKVECEPGKLSGECSGECSGSCDVKAGAKCDGTCQGSCDAEVKGSCSGKCNGKCDGKSSSGASCAGTCEGKCEGGEVKGECKGKCGGSCELKAKAKCEGTCTGNCSVEMKAPKCTGEVKPPEVSADCKAHCDAQVQAKAECTKGEVGVAITGAADAKAAEQYKAALEKNLPLILKVAIGMGDKAVKMAANVQTVVQGTLDGMGQIAASGGGNAALSTGKLTACFADTFKGAISAAGSLQANVKVSASVSTSASASGSAGGSASSK